MKILLVVTLVLTLMGFSRARGQVHTETIEYSQGGKILKGFLAYDPAIEGKRPGVLVIHEWTGLNDYARERARQLAEMGYVAFALDMYGNGVVAQNNKEAQELSAPFFKDRPLMRQRALAGLDALRGYDLTDPARLAVIGFCFGGTTALELAMTGVDLKATVSFHGVLKFPDTEGLKDVKGDVLVLDGGSDPNVPEGDLASLWAEMKAAGVAYQINIYGGAVHGFTNPANGNNAASGVAYDEGAARRAWAEMQMLFNEVL
jgi:dienelactone hydrolase